MENDPRTYVEHENKLLKIGVGSSAGTAVGLIKAVMRFHGITLSEHELFNTAFAAHRRAAGGLGSGADIATAAAGQAILFTSEILKITPLSIPENWYFVVGFSGTSASTPRLIEAFNIAREKNPLAIKNILDQIETVVQQLAQLPPADQSMRLINKNNDLLNQLSQACDGVLETPPLRQMIQLAQDCGAAAKFSGAGGGDCVIALCDSVDMKQRVEHAWQNAGFYPVTQALAIN